MPETENTSIGFKENRTSPESSPEQAAPPPLPKKKGRWRSFLFLFMFLLATAGGGAAWLLWQQMQEERAIQERAFHAVKQQSVEMQAQNALLQKRMQEEQAHRQALQEEVTKLEKSVSALYAMQRRAGDKEDWNLAEVAYLLGIAQQRLRLASDSGAALAALRSADGRLSEVPDPRYLPVREQLTLDINSLREFKMPDLTGTALRLNSYLAKIEELPLLQGRHTDKREEEQEKAAPGQEKRSLSTAVWEEMKQLVIIRRNQSGDVGLLAPEQSYFLVQNLRLKLETARFFALRRNTGQFRGAVEDALNWLRRYYDSGDAVVQAMADDLAQMQALELSPPLPDISQSLVLLQKLMREMENTESGGL